MAKPQQSQSFPDPRHQPTPKAPRGTTVTKPLPRQGGANRPGVGASKGAKK